MMTVRWPEWRAPENRATWRNIFIAIAVAAVTLFQLFVLPALADSGAGNAWITLLVLTLAGTNLTHWALIHEAIHGHLCAGRRANRLGGRLLAMLWGAPFDMLRAGHLLHHGHNRTPRDRAEAYDPARRSWLATAMAYYPRLLGGLYLAEVATCLPAAMGRRATLQLAHRIDTAETLAGLMLARVAAAGTWPAFRVDAFVLLGIHALAFALAGGAAWVIVMVVLARAAIASLTDNLYHHGTPIAAPGEASRTALDLAAPGWLQALMLNFNLHDTHHRAPELPWHTLTTHQTSNSGPPPRSWAAALAAQFLGPVSIRSLIQK